MEVVVKLSEPIQFGSEMISELKLRKLKAKDMRALPSEPRTGDILDLAARLSGNPPSVIDELCFEDTKRVLEAVANFIGAGPGIGDKR